MDDQDHYQMLGIARTATVDDIKKAYRKLARQHHPDVSKATDANQRMVALNEAHAVLSDPDRRAAYDALDREPPDRGGRGAPPPPEAWDSGFDFADLSGPAGRSSEFFEQLFGRTAPTPTRGGDHHAQIELDIQDAYAGADRLVVLRSTRAPGHGPSTQDERQLQIRIPKGVHEGQHIRLAGRGSKGLGGAPSGDLLLEVVFKPDPRWRAEGRDVYLRVSLAPWEAMLGATTRVQTPGGWTDVSFPAGWRSGRKLRLKGQGIPGSHPGNLYIEPELTLPPADTDDARAAYAALAKAFPAFEPRAPLLRDHAH